MRSWEKKDITDILIKHHEELREASKKLSDGKGAIRGHMWWDSSGKPPEFVPWWGRETQLLLGGEVSLGEGLDDDCIVSWGPFVFCRRTY